MKIDRQYHIKMFHLLRYFYNFQSRTNKYVLSRINNILIRIFDASFSYSYVWKPHLTEPLVCRPKSIFMGLSQFFSFAVILLETDKNNLLLAKTEKKYT